MYEIIRKLLSRKLWLALAGVTTGIAMILGITESEIAAVAGSVMVLGSVISYIIVEGKIDVKRLQKAAEAYVGGDIDEK